MANVYSKMYVQLVFAVKNRQSLLDKSWRNELFSYMAGTLNKRGNYSYAVDGSYDHVHLFIDYKGKELISDLVRELKKSSNDYIKNRKLLRTKFSWQSGYGVFSHGYRERDNVIKYVMNQTLHHQKRSFKKEYLQLLESYDIEFKDEYLFEFLD